MRRSIKLAIGFLIALPWLARAQAIGPGFELERAGRYADAASVYLTTVRGDPTNIPALLGLERALCLLNRMPELLPLVQSACAGNWEAAAAEWGRAVTRSADVGPNAASQLVDAPVALHDRVARVLTAPAPATSARARRLGAEVLLTWGQPSAAWVAMESTLGARAGDSEAPDALR